MEKLQKHQVQTLLSRRLLDFSQKSRLVLFFFLTCSILVGFSASAQITIFSEDFGGAFPGSWYVGNHNSNTTAKWGDNRAKASSGSWSCFCADNGNNLRTTYDNNLSTYLQRKNVSLAEYASATLTFKYWMNTESGWDKFEVNVRNSSGAWKNHMAISGNSSGWQTRTINLNEYVGQTGLYISFDFTSDASVIPSGDAGVWIDDVVLTATPKVDLAMRNLQVTLPADRAARTFTACSFDIYNYGPKSAANPFVEFYLSSDTTFGNADDKKIGDAGFAGVTVDYRETESFRLSQEGLRNMTRFWTEGLVSNGNYYLFAKVSCNGATETDPSDNVVRAGPFPYEGERTCVDLAMRNLRATRPSDTSARTFTACSFDIYNYGPDSAANPFVEYYLSADTTFGNADDKKIGDTGFAGVTVDYRETESFPLSSGGLTNMTRFWTEDLVPNGDYYLFARVSCSGATETDQSDNVICFGPFPYRGETRVDLAMRNLQVTRPPDTSVRIFTACSFDIYNYGPDPAANPFVEYYLSSDTTFGNADDKKIGDTGFAEVTVDYRETEPITLSQEGLTNMTRFWTEDLVPYGDYYLFAKVSCNGATETDPSDNVIRFGPFPYRGETRVDLAMRNLQVTRPPDTSVRTFTACSFDIYNYGPDPAANPFVEFYLSSDTTFGNADDKKIGDTGFAEVTVDYRETEPITLSQVGLTNMTRFWTEDLVPYGNYYLFVKVSCHGATETDPRDNVIRTEHTFSYWDGHRQVDLDIDNLQVTRPPDTSARAFTACSFDIYNYGPAPAANPFVEFYLSSDATFGNADDKKIGDTGFAGVTVDYRETEPITLSQEGLRNMTRFWTENLVSNGNYYLFAKVSCHGATETDPNDNVIRTENTFWYEKETPPPSGWRYPLYDRASLACSSEKTAEHIESFSLVELTAIAGIDQLVLTGDVDGDGINDLVTTKGSELLIYNGDGTLKSSINLPQPCFAAMLEDFDGDGVLDIGLGSSDKAYIYKSDGTQLKVFHGPFAGTSQISMRPIGLTETHVLMGYQAGYIGRPRGMGAFDRTTAESLWYYQIGPGCDGFSVADMYGDGKLYVTNASITVHNGASGNNTTDGDMYLIVLDEDGNALLSQKYPSPSDGGAKHVFADTDFDGIYEIVCFEDHNASYPGTSQIHIYSPEGETLHSFDGLENASWQFALGDVIHESDGLEIVASVNVNETLYILDKELNVINQTEGCGLVKALADVNGDGVLEIITLSDAGLLRILNSEFEVLASIQAGNKNGNVAVSDINGDGILDILCQTDQLYVFSIEKTARQTCCLTTNSVLNDQRFGSANNSVTVLPGGILSGVVEVETTNLMHPNAVAPLAGTFTWGERRDQYWTINGWIDTGVQRYSFPVECTVPTEPGDYYLIVGFLGAYNAAQVMSSTHAAIDAVWYDGNDIGFDWTEQQFAQALGNGGVVQVRTLLPDGSFQWEEQPYTAVRIRVSDPTQQYFFSDWSLSYYKLFYSEEGISWDDAKNAAENQTYRGIPGHLATITSAEENNFIVESFQEVFTGWAWLGADQEPGNTPDQGWRWITGEKWSYTNWRSSSTPEPNDHENKKEDALNIFILPDESYSHGKWNDLPREELLHWYIVEYPSMYCRRSADGSINNQVVDAERDTVSVVVGERLQGSFNVVTNNTMHAGAVAPLAATVTWGERTTQYWTVNDWIATGEHTYSIPVDCVAPDTPGDYYLIVGFSGVYTGAQVMSSTTTARDAVWNDGNDVGFDWTEAQLNAALANSGLVWVNILQQDDTFLVGAHSFTAVRIRVEAEDPVLHLVTFDLGEHGTRTGGGELRQEVEHGESATEPIFTVADGWEFTGWDKVFTNICEETTITALYRYVGDPWGEPVTYPNVAMTILAEVVMGAGEAVPEGSVVAAFVGDELRGKQVVASQQGRFFANLTVNVNNNGETLSFKLWNAATQNISDCATTVLAQSGESIGTPTDPVELAFGLVQQTLSLQAGWNHVSFHIGFADDSPGAVFDPVLDKLTKIISDGKNYTPGWGALNTLQHLRKELGHWVNMSSAAELIVSGRPLAAADTPIALQAGWNNVAFISDSPVSVETALAGIMPQVEKVIGEGKNFTPGWGALNSLTRLNPGKGYWIKTTADAVLIYQNAQTRSTCGNDQGELRAQVPWTPVQYPSTPFTLLASVCLDGQPAEAGDLVGVFVGDECRAVGEMIPGVGITYSNLTITVNTNGEKATCKFYDDSTGTILDGTAEVTLSTGGSQGTPDNPFLLNFTSHVTQHTVIFDLGEYGVRTGGGALEQLVDDNDAAIAPLFTVVDGWEFIGWDKDFSCVVTPLTVRAIYQPLPPNDFAFALQVSWHSGVNYTLQMLAGPNANDDYVFGEDFMSDLPLPPLPSPDMEEAFFQLPDSTVKLLRDVHFLDDTVDALSWSLVVAVPEGNPATLTWDSLAIPVGWRLGITQQSIRGVGIDMAEESSLIMETAGIYTFHITAYREDAYETFTYHLNAGWNMICATLELTAEAEAYLLEQGLMSLDALGGCYTPATDVIPGKGYWLFSATELTLQVMGRPVLDFALDIQPGWNFVGLIHDVALPNAGLIVWEWTPEGYRTPEVMDDKFLLLAGKGYWVYWVGN